MNFHLPNDNHPGPRCDCDECNVGWPDPFTPVAAAIVGMVSATMLAAGVPEAEDTFSKAMARVEELREANNERLARRDRAEWDCFFHFACENSLLRRQAE